MREFAKAEALKRVMFQISMFMRVILTLDLVSMAEGLAEGYVKIGKSATGDGKCTRI